MSSAKPPPGERKQIVLDTSVLLNFLRVGRLDLLVGLPEHEFLLTDHVRGEVTYPAQAATLQQALQNRQLVEVRVDHPGELLAFGRLTTLGILGVGECAALAVAVSRGLPIGIDDKAARKKALALFGFEQFIGSADLVALAIRAGMINAAEAAELQRSW